MGRNKSELTTRDAYARRFGALQCVRIHSARLSGDVRAKSVVIEAEDSESWDDVVLSVTSDTVTATTRYQIKRQQTEIAASTGASLFSSMVANDRAQYRIVVPANVDVSKVGALHTLRGLCDRVRQVGANWGAIEQSLRTEEKAWIDFIERSKPNDLSVQEVLGRFGVEFVGYEDDLDERAKDTLQPYYGDAWTEPWENAVALCAKIDGAATLDCDVLADQLSRPPSASNDELYWEMLRQTDKLLWLDRWPSVCAVLVGAMVPVAFADDVDRFRHEIHTTALPGTRPDFDQAIAELAKRFGEYIDHFMTRAERRYPNLYAEDLSWKRTYNPNYNAAAKKSRLWDADLIRLLQNAVVALNRFAETVRSALDSDYRRRGGVFAIYDEMGVRNPDHLVGFYVIPVEYDDEPAK